jgi:endonuclease/exonuclease/phosphatase family metal-dependent hydrolase
MTARGEFEVGFHGEFREIVPNERIVSTEVFEGFPDGEAVNTITFTEIDGPRGPIQVFCAHLSWRADHSGVRQEQVRAICEFVRETRPRPFPAVLLGDLNAPPTSDEIRMLTGSRAVSVPGVVFRDAWATLHPEDPGYTFGNDNPFSAANLLYDVRIDYVMLGAPKLGGVGQPLTAELIGNVPIDAVFGSDHFGLTVELRY